jgi:type I phosphodiesterase/nucleotide pyrophosphatase
MNRRIAKGIVSVWVCLAGLAVVQAAAWHAESGEGATFAHVLLLSVDGLHAADLERYVAAHPDSALAWLSASGRTYTNATATKPSDSFPGMLAMVTGGTPRSTGVYYDDGYDRALVPATGTCVPGAPAPGTRAQWKQNLDVVPVVAPFITSIDPLKLPRDPADCSRVFPHQFPRVNNVFELIKAAGGRTAWADKHPAYEFLNGPSGTGVDDLYTPEIASCDGILPCASSLVTTNFFSKTMAYDDMKVAAILHEIDGFDHTGTTAGAVPALFGMNFQAVSVGQKLDLTALGGAKGGYTDASGTPSDPLQAALEHTDQSIGLMVSALGDRGLLDSTLIIVSAKHGNSPVNPSALRRIDPVGISTVVNSVQAGLLALLSADTGPLIWLKDQTRTQEVVERLKAADPAVTGIDPSATGQGVLWGAALAALYPDPLTDSRTPDIILLPVPGTVYTPPVATATKIADHGGFGDDDVHVALLVSNPSLSRKIIDDPVETRQIACTILKALGMGCEGLQSERVEPSKFLPHADHKDKTTTTSVSR